MSETMQKVETTAVPQQGAQPVGQQANTLASFVPLLLMILVFYFLLIRPQQKRDAKKKEMLSEIKRGDRIVTMSGIIGTVHKVINENEVSLEISENVRIRILKGSIGEKLEKGSKLGMAEAEDEKVKAGVSKKSNKKQEKGSKPTNSGVGENEIALGE